MTNTKMRVTVKKRSVDGKTVYEGLVSLPNFVNTKLQKSNGETTYNNLNNLRQAARSVADKFMLDLNFVAETKVAAKRTK